MLPKKPFFMLKKYFPFVVMLFLLHSCSNKMSGLLEEPAHTEEGTYCKHFAYSLQYNEEWEQAQWVAWALEKEELENRVRRKHRFVEDPLVLTGTASDSDYKKSGFDRGHLAPAADMRWNQTAMDESFYYSNISPQSASFNRGIWKKLEKFTREMAGQHGCVYIVSGPLCHDTCRRIGANEVCVPFAFYKALLINNEQHIEAIGFLVPHEKSKADIMNFSISIDSLEEQSGLDFFPALPGRIENQIEKFPNRAFWR